MTEEEYQKMDAQAVKMLAGYHEGIQTERERMTKELERRIAEVSEVMDADDRVSKVAGYLQGLETALEYVKEEY